MDLKQIIFPSGVRIVIPNDTNNYIITDIETETMKSEFIFLGIGDDINRYKAIPKEAHAKDVRQSAEILLEEER